MASEIIMRTLDNEKDTFEMLVPPRNQIASNTVITGNPCHFSYGKLALVEHSLKVDFNSHTQEITIKVETHFKGNDPPILFDSYDVHFYSDGVTQGTFQLGFQILPLKANEDGFGNIKYIYRWKSSWKDVQDQDHLNSIWNNTTHSIKFVFNVKPTSEGLEQNLRLNMKDFLMDDFLSDLKILCENETLPAHRNVLASNFSLDRSPKLRAMFKTDMEETREGRLVVEGIKLEVLKELLRFMYTGNVDFKPDHLLDLFKAADEYWMPYLKDVCIRQIIKEISLENALDIYNVALTHDCKPLHDVAVKFLTVNKKLIEDEKLVEFCERFPDMRCKLIKL